MYVDGKYKGWIYLITNNLTGQLYVGQTCQGLKRRFYQHCNYYGQNSKLDIDIQLLGKENFIIEEIEEIIVDTEEEYWDIIDQKEIYWIEYYNTYKSDFHYNQTIGGNDVGINERKPVIAYTKHGNYLKRYNSVTEAANDYNTLTSAISRVCLEPYEYHSCQGVIFRYEDNPLTDDDVENLKLEYPTIYQYDYYGNLLNTFESVVEAYQYLQHIGKNLASTDSITSAINGHETGAAGFIWRKYPDKFDSLPIPSFSVNRCVEQRDKDTGELIKIYNSAKDASNELNLSYSSILGAMSHVYDGIEYHFAFGYAWYYQGSFDKDKFDKSKSIVKRFDKTIYQFNCYGDFLNEYPSMLDAANYTNTNYQSLCNCCNQFKGYNVANNYIWRYASDVNDFKKFKEDILSKSRKYDEYYPIVCFDENGQIINKYNSIKQLPITIKGIRAKVLKICRDKSFYRTNGYYWRFEIDIINQNFAELLDEFLKNKQPIKRTIVNNIPIVQLSLDGEFIADYSSYIEAERQTGIPNGQIRDTCIGKQKTCHGYKWMKKDDYLIIQK